MKYFVIFLVLIAVSYSINGVFAEEQSLTDDSTPTQWNEGKIKWYETSYPSGGTGVVQVIDPDMNLNPGKIDNFDVDVWSGSDFAGIDLTLTETDDSSGVFEGTVFFTTSDDSSGHRLRVEEGDTIFSKYDDITILKPNTTDELVLISTATIQGDSVSMIEDRITLDKESYAWDDIVFITITAPELNLDNKSIEKIDDPEKFPVEITTRHFEIDKYQLVETGVDTGIFSGKITLRGNELPNVDYNDDGISVFFEYEEDKVSIGSAPIVNDILSPKKQQQNGIPADEIKCKDGFVVAIKNTNGNPACVKPETKQKLMERGWAEPEPTPEPERATEDEMNLRDAKQKLREIYSLNSSFGPFNIKDVIVGYGIADRVLVVDVLTEYYESDHLDLIKQKIRDIVGHKVAIEFSPSGAIVPTNIESVFPYVWNGFLHRNGIEFTPKEQSYANTDIGYEGQNRVCSPIVASNGTEFYISSIFIHEPFEITGTFIDKIKPDDCYKVWKTDTILEEPDRILMLWLENYHSSD